MDSPLTKRAIIARSGGMMIKRRLRPFHIAALLLGLGAPATAADTPKPPVASAPFMRDLFPSTYRPLPRRDTLIVHATILDGDGATWECH